MEGLSRAQSDTRERARDPPKPNAERVDAAAADIANAPQKVNDDCTFSTSLD